MADNISVRDISRLIAEVYGRYRSGEISDQVAQRETAMLKAMLDAQIHIERNMPPSDEVKITVTYVDELGKEIS